MTISRVFPQPLRPLRPIRFHPEGAACRGEAQFGFAHGSTSLSVPEQRRRDRPELVEGAPRPYFFVATRTLSTD